MAISVLACCLIGIGLYPKPFVDLIDIGWRTTQRPDVMEQARKRPAAEAAHPLAALLTPSVHAANSETNNDRNRGLTR